MKIVFLLSDSNNFYIFSIFRFWILEFKTSNYINKNKNVKNYYK